MSVADPSDHRSTEADQRCSPALPAQRSGLSISEHLSNLRDSGRLARMSTAFGQPATVVSRYQEARALLADADGFRVGTVPPPQELIDAGFDPDRLRRGQVGNLVSSDPPDHTRLRRMLTPWFTGRRIERMRPRVDRIIAETLDAMERQGPPADLVRSFAWPVPVTVVCELIGIPPEYRRPLRTSSAPNGERSTPIDELRRLGEDGWVTHELLEWHRREPGEDLICTLLREHGSAGAAGDLTDDELIGLTNSLLVAGHETTTQVLALGTLALLQHPEQLALIRSDQRRIPDAIEELLRYVGVLHGGFIRRAERDVMLGEHRIRAGELVVPALAAANRDPELVADGDRLDITRPAVPHLALSHGIHFCLGAPLARLELRAAVPALLSRFPGLRLAVPESELRFSNNTMVYKLASLPVTW